MSVHRGYQPRTAWSIAVLITCLALINFLDKIVLGMVAVPLMAELKLDPSTFGLLAGSFFWLFSLSSIALSFLANRYPTRWILLGLAVSWSVLQIPLTYAASAFTILLCRLILGVAEGPSAAISAHALFKWFPDERRSLPMALVNQGGVVGLVLAGLLIPQVSKHWGWRMNFVLLAGLGAAWCLLWLRFGREGSIADRPGPAGTYHAQPGSGDISGEPQPRVAYRHILGTPSVLAIFLLGFSAYWSVALILTWLPTYLEKGLGFDAITSGRLFAVILLLTAPYTFALSWLSERMLARGAPSRKARVGVLNWAFLFGGTLLCSLALLDMQAAVKVVVLGVATCLPSICFGFAPAILGGLVPTSQRSAVMGVYVAVATSAGAIAPALVGRLVQAHGSLNARGYELGFAIGGALLIIAAVLSARYLHPDRARQSLRAATAEVA